MDVSLRVRRDRAASIKSEGEGQDVARLLEGRAGIVEARVDHGMLFAGNSALRNLALPHPGHVEALVLADGQRLTAAIKAAVGKRLMYKEPVADVG